MTFPFTMDGPPAYQSDLPDTADVVVIGAGIIGIMTAWDLAKSGLRVVVLEKGRVAGEQSSRNWGWIRAQGRDIAEIPIMQDAQRMWVDLAKQVGEIGLRQTGTYYLAKKPNEMDRFQDWLEEAKPYGVSSVLLSAGELKSHLTGAVPRWAGALYTPTDYRAEPALAVPAFARAAAADGVQIIEGCAARLVDVEAGRVSGVITPKGRIKTSSVVIAGGSWSSLMLRRIGVSIPQLSVRATVAATDVLPEVFKGGAVDERLAFRRRLDGGYTLAPSGFHELFIGPDAFRALGGYARQLWADPLGTKLLPAAPKGYPDAWGTARHWAGDAVSPFEKMPILNPSPNAAKVAKMAADFGETFPELGEVRIKTAWAGMIDAMPDVVPVVDHAPLQGVTIATGMCGHGFGIGPAFGRLAAQLVRGDTPDHDLSRFRFNRFTDGSKLVLGPNL